ncbi:molybdopterin-guanine dinucleotide biosynthesis protein B [bacterium]|nr:molybdopterin-guanine dinucleotide biosynthesis protein B [bacterium]
MKAIHIIGRKNSGKTTLIVELIQHFSSQGIRVGSIKHTHHRHELDVPGKDSFRHREAGANPVAILSPGMTAIFRPNPSGDASDGYEWIEPLFGDCELVLVEGNSATSQTKLEVWRKATLTEPMALHDSAIRAVISDDTPEVPQPVWRRNDIVAIADRILKFVRE